MVDLLKAISHKRCKIWPQLQLVTNRKEHMRNSLVLLSMTLTHPEPGFQGQRSFPSSVAQKSR